MEEHTLPLLPRRLLYYVHSMVCQVPHRQVAHHVKDVAPSHRVPSHHGNHRLGQAPDLDLCERMRAGERNA